MNLTKTLACPSGTGKSQSMRGILDQFELYEKTTNRDVVARNVTIESLEARMFANSMREAPIDGVKVDDVRQGSALVSHDEGNKIVSMGQYKAGKSDHRERWMEAANGELIKTDSKGGSSCA